MSVRYVFCPNMSGPGQLNDVRKSKPFVAVKAGPCQTGPRVSVPCAWTRALCLFPKTAVGEAAPPVRAHRSAQVVGAREGREGKAEGAPSAGLTAEPVPWGSGPVDGGDSGDRRRPVQRQDGRSSTVVGTMVQRISWSGSKRTHRPQSSTNRPRHSQTRDVPSEKTWSSVRIIFLSAQGELRQSSGEEGKRKK